MSSDARIPTGLSSTITLNDGVVMPMFGLGTYQLSTGAGGGAETITSFALQNGYRLVDTQPFTGVIYAPVLVYLLCILRTTELGHSVYLFIIKSYIKYK